LKKGRILHVCFLVAAALFLGHLPGPLAMPWNATNYDDTSWSMGTAELGFGDGDEATVLESGHIAYYFRKLFYISNTLHYDILALRVNYDDGFVAYINGMEVKRSNMPDGTVTSDTPALGDHEGGAFEEFDISWYLDECEKGWGDIYLVLAVEVHQRSPSSSDVSFDAALVGDGTHEFVSEGAGWSYSDSGSEPSPIASDPITVIEKPLPNIPVIVEKGGDFTVRCNAPPSATNWEADILAEYQSYTLTTSATYDAGISRWLITATIPTDVPEELYSLHVEASGAVDDTAANALKVIGCFKDEYTFVHITDTHVPEHFGGYDSVADFNDVVGEINIINPEFVLLTGDGLNRGQAEDQNEVLQNLLAEFDAPVFFTSGNHEIASWCGDQRDRRNFWKYFGWEYLNPDEESGRYTQDYSFDYGNAHFVGLESYKDYTPGAGEWWSTYQQGNFAAASQRDWLNSDLSSAPPAATKYLFFHYDFYHHDYPYVDTLTEILDAHGVSACFIGHIHGGGDYYQGSTPTLMLNPGSVVRNRKYRVVKMAGGEIVEHHGLTSGNLSLSFYPDNDGTNEYVSAKVDNQNSCSFEDALIRFRVPDNGQVYQISQGEIVQVIDAGDFLVYYVLVDVDAGSSTSAAIFPDGTPVRINFQPAGAALPGEGWQKDAGEEYDPHRLWGYGWQ